MRKKIIILCLWSYLFCFFFTPVNARASTITPTLSPEISNTQSIMLENHQEDNQPSNTVTEVPFNSLEELDEYHKIQYYNQKYFSENDSRSITGALTLGSIGSLLTATGTLAPYVGIAVGAGLGAYVVAKGLTNLYGLSKNLISNVVNNYNANQTEYDTHIGKSNLPTVQKNGDLYLPLQHYTLRYTMVEDILTMDSDFIRPYLSSSGNFVEFYKDSKKTYGVYNNTTLNLTFTTAKGSACATTATACALITPPDGYQFMSFYPYSNSLVAETPTVTKTLYYQLSSGINFGYKNATRIYGDSTSTVAYRHINSATYTFDAEDGKSYMYLDLNEALLKNKIYLVPDSASTITVAQSVIAPINKSYTIPATTIGVANPSLNFDGNNWVNSNGETVDVTIPLPNKVVVNESDNSTSIEFDKDYVVDNVTPDTPVIPDTGVAWLDTIIGWLNSILEAIFSLPQLIADAFTSLVNGITSVLSNIWSWCQALPQTLSDILSSMLGALSSTLANIWSWCQALPGTIVGAIEGVIDTVLAIPQAIADAFVAVFVPTEGFFENQLTELGNIFNSKIPIFKQIGDILKAFSFSVDAKIPEFKITLPDLYGGGTYSIIDLSVVAEYRVTILNLIRVLTWVPFLIRMYKKSVTLATGH